MYACEWLDETCMRVCGPAWKYASSNMALKDESGACRYPIVPKAVGNMGGAEQHALK